MTPANEQDRAQVARLTEELQAATGEMVEVAFVDQGYTDEQPAEAAEARGGGTSQAGRPVSTFLIPRLLVRITGQNEHGFSLLLPRTWCL